MIINHNKKPFFFFFFFTKINCLRKKEKRKMSNDLEKKSTGKRIKLMTYLLSVSQKTTFAELGKKKSF